MPYESNNDLFMQAAGPGLGSFVLGQQQAQKQQLQDQALVKGLADLYSSQQTYSQNEQKFPYTLEDLRLTNVGKDLTNQGTAQTNRKLGVEADIAEATKQGSINKTNSANSLAIMQDDVNKAATVRAQLQQTLANAQALGPGGAAQAIQQLQSSKDPMLQQYGARLAQTAATGKGDPLALLQKGLDAVNTHLTQVSAAYQTEMDKQRLANEGHIASAKYTADKALEGHKYTADKGLERFNAGKSAMNAYTTAKTSEAKSNAAAALALQFQDSDPVMANRFAIEAKELWDRHLDEVRLKTAPAAANAANKPDLNAMGVPTVGKASAPAALAPRGTASNPIVLK